MTLASQHEIFQPLAMRKGRVLIVDDELSIRMPIRRNLLQAGLEVIEATDGEQAIAALREGDNALMVDAVLCDIRMPNVNVIDELVDMVDASRTYEANLSALRTWKQMLARTLEMKR